MRERVRAYRENVLGKTHLAIALETMRGGKQALFRTVPEMLDELRLSWQKRDYFNVKQKFMDVPCLVLDDLGENDAGRNGIPAPDNRNRLQVQARNADDNNDQRAGHGRTEKQVECG